MSKDSSKKLNEINKVVGSVINAIPDMTQMVFSPMCVFSSDDKLRLKECFGLNVEGFECDSCRNYSSDTTDESCCRRCWSNAIKISLALKMEDVDFLRDVVIEV